MEAYIDSRLVKLLSRIQVDKISAPFRIFILAFVYAIGLALSVVTARGP